MNKILVYDLPTRFFHWLFVVLFACAFGIAKTIDDDSPLYSYHMLAGLCLGFLVLLRIFWGLVGSTYSRFSHFALKPKDLINYFLSFLNNDKKRWPGHNPASSWAAIAMMMMALGLATSGVLMASGYKEELEDIHELLANGFLVTALAHIAGLAIHTIRHKEMIGLSMITGQKQDFPESEKINSQHLIPALVLILIMSLFAYQLLSKYDTTTGQLNVFGKVLQLGENESDENRENGDD